jgi:hypothetical protein
MPVNRVLKAVVGSEWGSRNSPRRCWLGKAHQPLTELREAGRTWERALTKSLLEICAVTIKFHFMFKNIHDE